MADLPNDQEPATDAEKLREAALWFDLVDQLLDLLEVSVKATGETYQLIDQIGRGNEIQTDLREIADRLEALDG